MAYCELCFTASPGYRIPSSVLSFEANLLMTVCESDSSWLQTYRTSLSSAAPPTDDVAFTPPVAPVVFVPALPTSSGLNEDTALKPSLFRWLLNLSSPNTGTATKPTVGLDEFVSGSSSSSSDTTVIVPVIPLAGSVNVYYPSSSNMWLVPFW